MTRAASYFFALLSLLIFLSVFHNGYVDYRNTALFFIIVLSVAFIVLVYTVGLRASDNKSAQLLILYVVWLSIAYFISDVSLHAWAELPILLSLPLMAILWLSLRKTQLMDWKALGLILDVLIVVLVAWSFYDFFITGKRSTGPFLDTNAYAALLNLRLIPLFVTLSMNSQTNDDHHLWLKYLYLFCLASAMLMTQSRGALLALSVSLIVFGIWLLIKRLSIRGWVFGLVIVLASFLAVTHSGQGVSKRLAGAIAEAGQVGVGNSSRLRIFLWKTGLEIYQDNDRLFGTGLGSFRSYYAERRLPDDTTTLGHMAHNDYIQFLVEGGPLHLLFLLGIAIVLPLLLLNRVIRNPDIRTSIKSHSIGLWLALFYLSLHAVVNFIYLVLGIAVIAGLYLGELIYLGSKPQEEKAEEKEGRLVKLGVTLVAVVIIYKAVMEVATLGLFSSQVSPIQNWTLDKTIPIAKALRKLNPGNPATAYFLSTANLQLLHRVSDPEIRQILLLDMNETTEQLIEMDERDPKALFLRANFMLSQNKANKDRAILLLKRSLELDPWFTDSAMLLGHLETESAAGEEKGIKSYR